MDPLSITGTVLAITGQCLSTAKILSDLKSRYDFSSATLTAICAEATVISSSLAQVQSTLLRAPAAMSCTLEEKPDLRNTMDTALLGCSVVFSALSHELDELQVDLVKASRAGWKTKAKFLWKEGIMKDLLCQIRGQQSSLNFLINTLQMESMSDMSSMIQNYSTTLEQLARTTLSLKKSYPTIKVAKSIFDYDDDVSMVSRRASTAGATEFDFDAFIIDSHVYRRAFAGGYLRPRQQHMDDEDDADDDEEGDAATIRDYGEDEDDNGKAETDQAEEEEGASTPKATEKSRRFSFDQQPEERIDIRHDDAKSLDGSTVAGSEADGSSVAESQTRDSRNDVIVEAVTLAMQNQNIQVTNEPVKTVPNDYYMTIQVPKHAMIALNNGESKELFEDDIRAFFNNFTELREKYNKVKKYYFEQVDQVQALRKEKDEEIADLQKRLDWREFIKRVHGDEPPVSGAAMTTVS